MDQETELVALLRRRTQAGWIDVLALVIIFVGFGAATGNAHFGDYTSYASGSPVQEHGFNVTLTALPTLIFAVIALLYYAVPETLTGQSLGKYLRGLKVVKLDGAPADLEAVVVRTLGRVIDGLPVFYLVGYIVMRGPRRPPQRLGDRWADTTVVTVTTPPAGDNHGGTA